MANSALLQQWHDEMAHTRKLAKAERKKEEDKHTQQKRLAMHPYRYPKSLPENPNPDLSMTALYKRSETRAYRWKRGDQLADAPKSSQGVVYFACRQYLPKKDATASKWRCDLVMKVTTMNKVIHHDANIKHMGRDLYTNELRIYLQLHRRGLTPRLYDYWVTRSGEGVLIMEFVPNSKAMLVGEPDLIPFDRSEYIWRRILQPLHKLGVALLDVHGGNILYQAQRNDTLRPILIDFGIAARFGAVYPMAERYGTLSKILGQKLDMLTLLQDEDGWFQRVNPNSDIYKKWQKGAAIVLDAWVETHKFPTLLWRTHMRGFRWPAPQGED
jgi:serine/threonine protein kinase